MPDDTPTKTKKNGYISLTEATNYCEHSQEYLSKISRLGRLKAIKIGRNWVTTRKWLKSYINKAKEVEGRIPDRSKLTGSTRPTTSKKPRFTLPKQEKSFWFGVLVTVLVFLLIITGTGFIKGYWNTRPVRQFLSNGVNEIGNKLVEIGKDIERGFEDFSLVVGAVYKEFSNSAIRQLSNFVSASRNIYAIVAKRLYGASRQLSDPFITFGSDIARVGKAIGRASKIIGGTAAKTQTGQAISSGVRSASLVLSNGIQHTQASLVDFGQALGFGAQWTVSETKSFFVGSAKDISAGIANVGLRIKETTIKVVSAGLSLTETILVRVKIEVLSLVRDISFRSTSLVRNAFTKIRLGSQKTVSVLSAYKSALFQRLGNLVSKFRKKVEIAEGPELAEEAEGPEPVEPAEQTITEVLERYQTLKKRLDQLEFVLQEKEIIRKEVTEYITQEVTKVVEVPKEITKITEITREKITEIVKTADYSKLEQEIQALKTQIAREELALATLSSRISQISDASGFITSPRQYQEEGDLIFSTIGTGSIILSAAQSVLLQGDKIILDANAPNNLGVSSIEIRDDVNMNSSLSIGGTNFVADNLGNLTLAGDLTADNLIVSDITASGDLDITGGLTISASTTLATLTVEDYLDFTPISQPSTQQGRQYYDTSQDKMFFYNGSDWKNMSGAWEQASGYIYPSNVDTSLQIADTSGNMTLPGSLDIGTTLKAGTSDAFQVDADGNIDTSGTLTVGTANAFQVDVNGNITAPQLSSAGTLTLQSSGSSNIILNSAGTIELQDATNIDGNLNIGGGYSLGGVTITTGGNVQAAGDFYIQGSLYRESLQELLVQNHTIQLNYGGSAQDAYIKVYNTPAEIKWDNATSTWVFANPITLSATSTISVGSTILSDGTLDLGSGSNDDLTASDITDLTDAGATALHKHGGSKTDFFAPEYESADLHADGSNNTGTMVSDSEIVSNVVYNYYEWTSGEATKQDYDIIINLRVPDTFSSWQSNAITFFYKTGLTGTTNNAVSWEIYEDGNASALMSSGEMASSVADTWASDSATSSELSALTAGNLYRIIIKLAANSTASAAAYAGKITVNYTWYTN